MEHKKGEAFKPGRPSMIKGELPLGYKRNLRTVASPGLSDSMKGPAFWSASTKQRRQLPIPQIQSQDKVPTPPRFLGIESWWQMLVFLLVSAALVLFCILMCSVGIYLKKANDLNTVIPRLQVQEQRLKEAVKREAIGKTLICKACPDEWLQYADTCYMSTKTLMSWKECINKCKELQGSLLIGKTEGEMEYLLLQIQNWFFLKRRRHRIPGRYWIGLMYNVSRKSWHWADGEYLHLRLSAISKQPAPPMDSCVMFTSGHAVIKNCGSLNSCLCKAMVQ